MVVENITIGADPELFIINEKTGKVISSIGLIPGEKGNPYVGEDMPEGFGLETDNILAEFNIPPVKNKIDFLNVINYMKNYINDFVKKINPDYGIKCSAYEVVDASQLKSKEAKLFGCDPDFNAYTGQQNPKPEGTKTNGRSAGFHIHIGYPKHNVDTSLMLVRYLDAFLGLPSLQYDSNKERRSLYGKAGAFRLQDHGVEYRSMSSALMKDNDTLSFVWDGVMKAINAYNNGVPIPSPSDVCNAINNSDVELATCLIRKYRL